MSALLTTGIVLGSVAGWFALGWKLAGPCARRYLARANHSYPSLKNTSNRSEALFLGSVVAALWFVGLAYLAFWPPLDQRSRRIKKWLPEVYLAELIKQNEKRAKEMGL